MKSCKYCLTYQKCMADLSGVFSALASKFSDKKKAHRDLLRVLARNCKEYQTEEK
jgi:hypothetical protein